MDIYMAVWVYIVGIILTITSLSEADIQCGIFECSGSGVYCCRSGGRGDEVCCYSMWNYWWFWVTWLLALIVLTVCACCCRRCCIQRRHTAHPALIQPSAPPVGQYGGNVPSYMAGSRVQPTAPPPYGQGRSSYYETPANQYTATGPVGPRKPPSYTEKPPSYTPYASAGEEEHPSQPLLQQPRN